MESVEGKMRLRLVLGKFQVTKVDKGLTGLKAFIVLGSGVTMSIDIPPGADLRPGDWLTYYTECPYAQPNPASVQ